MSRKKLYSLNSFRHLLTGAFVSLLAACTPFTGSQLGPTQLVVQPTNSASALLAGTCTGIQIAAIDRLGKSADAKSEIQFQLQSSVPGTFFTSSDCSNSSASSDSSEKDSNSSNPFTLPKGANSMTVYFQTTQLTSAMQVTVVPLTGGISSTAWTGSVNPGAPNQIILQGATSTVAQSMSAGTCKAYMIEMEDSLGNPTVSAKDTDISFTFSTPSTVSASLYTDQTCTQATTAIVLEAATSTATFYFKDERAETMTLNASAQNLSGFSQPFITTANTIAISGAKSLVAGTCSPYSVGLEDASGAAASYPVNLTLSLTGNSKGAFFSNSTCTTTITSVLIPVGTSTATVYFEDKSIDSTTLNINNGAGGLSAGTLALTVTAAAAAQIALAGGSATATAGTCSSVNTLTSLDALGNLSNVTTALTIALTGGTATYYSDSACTSAITSATIKAATDSTTFYFKQNASGSLTITATAAALASASAKETVTVNPAAAKVLVMTVPSSVTAGACVAFPIVTQDTFANVSPVTASTAITLAGSTDFFSDSACTKSTTSLTLAAATSSTTAYFLDPNVGSVSISISATGFTGATAAFSVAPAPPSKIALTGPTSFSAGSCSTAFTATMEDAFNNPITGTSASTLSLGGGKGIFYSDSGCTAAITTLSIATGSNPAMFYYKDNSSEQITLTVSGNATSGSTATTLTSGSLAVTINPAPPSKIAITGTSTFASGLCEAFSVITEDFLSNPSGVVSATTINLTGSGSGTFYSDSACTMSATSLTYAVAASTKTIYFKDAAVQALTFTATDAANKLTAGTLAIKVNPSQIALTGPSTSITAGSCQSLTVTAEGANGSPATVIAATPVNFTGGSSTIYSDSACTVTALSPSIASGSSALSLYIKDTKAETFTLQATATGIGSASLPLTFNSAAISQIVFTTGGASITAGTCSGPYTLSTRDQFSNTANATTALVLTLSGQDKGGFFSDSGCSVSAPSITVAVGTSTASFYIKDTLVENLSVAVNPGPGISSAALTVAVVSAQASKIVFTSTGATTFTAGNCAGPYAIATEDQYSNAANEVSALAIAVAGMDKGGFFADSACSSSLTTIPIAAGKNSTTFYFKDTKAETLTVTLSSSPLTSASLGLTINPAAASQLAVTGPAKVSAGTCSAAFTITTEDTYGNTSSITSSASLTLGGAGAGTFFSDAGCNIGITTVAISASSSTGTFYLQDTTAQSLTVTASGGSLTAGSLAVTVSPGTPNTLSLTGSALINAGACNTYTIKSIDAYNNPAPPASALTITLTGNGSGSYYSNSTCTTAVPTTTIATTASSTTIYFLDKIAETLTLAANSSGLTGGTTGVTVNGPALLEISNGPTFNFPTIPLNTSEPMTFTVQNNGAQTATAMTAGAPAATAPFAWAGTAATYPGGGTCGTTLAAGATCTIIATFSPTTVNNNFNSTIRVSYSDGVATQLANRAVTATSTPAPGTLDTSFHANGKAINAISATANRILSIGVDTNGNIDAAGYANNGTFDQMAVARYLPTGNLDSTFGTNGVTLTEITAANDHFTAVSLLSSGKIFAAGYTASTNGTSSSLSLAQYIPAGTLDSSFNPSGNLPGTASHSISNFMDQANANAVDSSGNLLIAGQSNPGGSTLNFAIARFEPVGASLDTSFNSSGSTPGVVTTAIGSSSAIQSMALDSSGNIVVGGYSTQPTTSNDFTIARYTSSGVLDTTFGVNGVVLTDFGGDDRVRGIAIDSTGAIWAGGYTCNGTNCNIAVAKYLSNGSLDTTFNTTGKFTLTPPAGYTTSYGTTITIQSATVFSKGYGVVGGYILNTTTNLYDFVLVRIKPTGVLDTTFNTTGILPVVVGSLASYVQSVVIQPADGKIVAAGYANNGGTDDNFALIRVYP